MSSGLACPVELRIPFSVAVSKAVGKWLLCEAEASARFPASLLCPLNDMPSLVTLVKSHRGNLARHNEMF